MSDPKLLGCPFCGNPPRSATHLTYSNYGVVCDCGAIGPTFNAGYRPPLAAEVKAVNDAIEAWNTRAALAERAEPVAKVRVHRTGGNAGIAWSAVAVTDGESLPLMPDGAKLYAAPPALPQDAARAEPDDVQREALRRLWPLIEKGTRGFAFTADKAGEVAADKNTLRQWIDAPVPGEGGGA